MARRCLPLFLWTGGLTAQTCLVLSPPAIQADGTALLDLSLYSHGRVPAAVQWTFQYSPSNITSLTVNDGPQLGPAGKTVMCAGDSTHYRCLALGTNANPIANGVIAKVTATLAPGATSAAIQIDSPLGTAGDGYMISISSRILPLFGATVSSDCRLHPPVRGPVR
jgi:hypothetical protein